jgi:D-amino-acid dehydrogenase
VTITHLAHGMSDIVVIGGGIVGSAAAYHLARLGIDVTLVDRRDAGQATAAGAGIIAPSTSFKPPPDFYDLSARSVAYYASLLAHLAEDGESDTGYEAVGSLLVAWPPACTASVRCAESPARRRRTCFRP